MHGWTREQGNNESGSSGKGSPVIVIIKPKGVEVMARNPSQEAPTAL